MATHPLPRPPASATVSPLAAALIPELSERAWCSVPHPDLPLLATPHASSVTIYSLSTLSAHSTLSAGHTRSIRSVSWKPGLPATSLCLATGSFDSNVWIWRRSAHTHTQTNMDSNLGPDLEQANPQDSLEQEHEHEDADDNVDEDADDGEAEWVRTALLEGHDSEIKSVAFSPSGALIATCSRDKSIWIWEDVGGGGGGGGGGGHGDDDDFEVVAVLNEHDGDVKAVAWCPDVAGRNARRRFGPEVLASASYDNTARIWREDWDGDWVCVAALVAHAATVWALAWEPEPAPGCFPRLATCSADATVRMWSLAPDSDPGPDPGPGLTPRLLPNTMRSSLRETWTCTAILPALHDGHIYSLAWSATTHLLASTGADGRLAVYAENPQAPQADSSSWCLLSVTPAAHGPYEVNHVSWCRRFDSACPNPGVEEMLVTTGDDGSVRPWHIQMASYTGIP